MTSGRHGAVGFWVTVTALVLLAGLAVGWCAVVRGNARADVTRKDALLDKARLRMECGEVKQAITQAQRDAERRARIEGGK